MLVLSLLFGNWSHHETPLRECKVAVDSAKLCMDDEYDGGRLGETFIQTVGALQ